MKFNPSNPIVQLCLQGMSLEEKDQPENARQIFLQAWEKAKTDFEKFMTAYYLARHQKNTADKLSWLQVSLQLALKINDEAVRSAFAPLYTKMAQCYEELGDVDNANKHHTLAASFINEPTDKGPFYHGTKASLKTGDLLTPGRMSNYQSDLVMNHIYFTALLNGAGLAAALAKGDGLERVYMVEPTGSFEDDPNVTNKKFPGNPTRSYRTKAALKVIGEISDWRKQTPEELQKWRDRLADNKGKIEN